MIAAKYRAKIKSVDEICDAIGPRPRKKKVIMCHGTFDVVHPGHIRHLMYARDKADLLIASVTCDEHIKKAHFRPFVPEQLRAINLAALDMVDFVLIDRNARPLENIARVQPDYYAKGYEYVSTGMPRATQEEKAVLDWFGGEIIFTPGDIVYSSSKLIEASPPNLAHEKLLALLEAEALTFHHLRRALDSFAGIDVHVIGDTIVDSYTQTSMIGGQTKTPTMSVRFDGQEAFVGGAGVVAKHLKAAGANVTFSTVLGRDQWAEFVCADLQKAGVVVEAIADPTRPTTNKNAIVCGGYRLLKVDTLDNRTISDRIQAQLANQINSIKAQCVMFCDFRHGIFNRETIPRLTAAIPPNAFKVADSQVASRWGNICDFRSFDLITPNEREARFALGDQDSVVRPLAQMLYERANCRNLILKLGERGLIAYRRREAIEDLRSFFAVDTFAEHVVDPVGAGDALLAYATLAHIATGNEVTAAVLGAMAAAVTCEQDGNVAVGREDVIAKIGQVERCATYCAEPHETQNALPTREGRQGVGIA